MVWACWYDREETKNPRKDEVWNCFVLPCFQQDFVWGSGQGGQIPVCAEK